MSKTTVEIHGKETVSDAAKKAGNALSKDLGNATGGLIRNFTDLTAAGLVVTKAIGVISDAAMQCVTSFAEQEKEVVKWNAAMATSEQISARGADALRYFAEGMSRLTGEDDEAILGMESFLATSGRTADEIERIISAAADMAVVTGDDLRGAVEKLNATYSGTAGRLEKLVPALDGLTEAELKNGGAIDIIARQYEGLADSMGGTMDVQLKNLKNSWDDLMAAVGQQLTPTFSPMIIWLQSIIDKWQQAIVKTGEYQQALKDISSDDIVKSLNAQITLATNKRESAEADRTSRMREAGLSSSYDAWVKSQTVKGTPSKFITLDEYKKQLDIIYDIFKPIIDAANKSEASAKAALDELKPAAPPPGGKPVGDGGGGSGGKPSNLSFGGSPFSGSWLRDSGFTGQIITDLLATAMASWEDPYGGTKGQGGLTLTESFDPYEGTKGQGGLVSNGLNITAPIDATKPAWAGLMETLGMVDGRFTGMLGSISSIKAILDPLGIVLQGIATTITPMINDILNPIIKILGTFGNIIGSALVPWLTILAETVLPYVMFVLKTLATVLEIVISPFRFLGDLLGWVGRVLTDFAWNITHLFGPQINTAGTFSSDAFSGLADRIAKIWSDEYSSSAVTPEPQKTAGSSASYSKPRDITLNIQINTQALVGEGGIRDFAIMISRELKSAGVLGMA